MHYSTGRDYLFPLVDAAYRTLVIFVYIVRTLGAYQLVPRKRPGCTLYFHSNLDI